MNLAEGLTKTMYVCIYKIGIYCMCMYCILYMLIYNKEIL